MTKDIRQEIENTRDKLMFYIIDNEITRHDDKTRRLRKRLERLEEELEGTLCPDCGLGWALHNSLKECPETHDRYRCIYCGGWGRFIGAEVWECQGDCGLNYTVEDQEQEIEQDDKPLFTPAPNELLQGKMDKALDRKYRFDDGVMSLRVWLESRELTHKTKHVRKYAKRKRRGVYKELKNPATTYTIWVGECGIEVPKLVWDSLTVKEKGE